MVYPKMASKIILRRCSFLILRLPSTINNQITKMRAAKGKRRPLKGRGGISWRENLTRAKFNPQINPANSINQSLT